MMKKYKYVLCIPVYNTFPFIIPTIKQKEEIINLVDNILTLRNSYSDSSLADLYDPLFKRYDLMDMHKKLDTAVENLYSNKRMNSDLKKLEI